MCYICSLYILGPGDEPKAYIPTFSPFTGKKLTTCRAVSRTLLTIKIEIFLTIAYDLNIVAIFPILDVSWGPDYPSEM